MAKTEDKTTEMLLPRRAEVLEALANGKRLQMLDILLRSEMSVGALSKKIELSQSALSQHLSRLRAAGLVDTRRDRQLIYYSCNSPAVMKIISMLREFFE